KEESQKEKENKENKENKESKEVMATGERIEYLVEEGDTLASISLKFFQSYSYVEILQKLNEIDDSDKIYTGQKLQLPQK
ncbi:MAG: LysM domain-containing protein, partial [Acetivibrio sp.]